MSVVAQLPRPAVGHPPQARPALLRGIGAVLLIVTLIPYLCGYWLAPPDKSFLGALNNIGDLSQYLAAIRQGTEGAWRYTNQFTPDHAQPLLMYSPYLLAGHLSLGISPSVVYQLLRLICGGFCLFALAEFCRLFIGSQIARAAWLFVVMAGGLYWLALPAGPLGLHLVEPAVLTAPELNPLITILISPHESLGLGAEVLGFVCMLRGAGAHDGLWLDRRDAPRSVPRRDGRPVLGAAVCFLLLALSYPFLLPTTGLTLLAYALIASRGMARTGMQGARPRRQLRATGLLALELRAVVLALIPAGAVGLYYFAIFRHDPFWSRSGLTEVGRPDPLMLLFAFGPLALGAAAGMRRLAQMHAGEARQAAWVWFPAIWIAVNALTLLLPIWQQGRQALGLSVPLALLSFQALARTLGPRGETRVVLPALPAAALAFSAPLLLALYTAITAGAVNPNYYVPSDAMRAVDWLGAHARANDVVLASAGFGNLVPEQCSCRVVIGQNFQSFRWAVRQAEVHAFYAAPSRAQAQRALAGIVHTEGVSFYVVSPLESGIGHANVRAVPGFHLRYQVHEVSIYGRVGSSTLTAPLPARHAAP